MGHGLGILFALACLACSSSHLQTTSVFFHKLQKGTRGPEVPTQTIVWGRRALAREEGSVEIGVLLSWFCVPCLSFRARPLSSYLEHMMTGSYFKRKIILDFYSKQAFQQGGILRCTIDSWRSSSYKKMTVYSAFLPSLSCVAGYLSLSWLMAIYATRDHWEEEIFIF